MRLRPALVVVAALLTVLALHSVFSAGSSARSATPQVQAGTAAVTDLLLNARLAASRQAAAAGAASHEPLAASSSSSSSSSESAAMAERREQPEAAQRSVAEALAHPDPPVGSALRGIADSEQAKKESDTVRRLLQLDGQPQWTTASVVGRPLPAVHPPNADVATILSAVPAGGTAWLGFGSAGVLEMLTNWAHHVIQLGYGDAMLIGAFDETILRELRARGLPAYNLSGALPEVHFRHAPYLFHRMGFLKAELIAQVLRTGRHVLVSDSDVAWVKVHFYLTNKHALSRIFATTHRYIAVFHTHLTASR